MRREDHLGDTCSKYLVQFSLQEKYKMVRFIIILYSLSFLVFVSNVPANAKMYKWVDENGVAHFSDQRPVDEEDADVKVLRMVQPDKTPVEVKKKRAREKKVIEEKVTKYEIPPEKRKTAKVELFVNSWNKWCKRAKAFFRENGIQFKEYDVERDREASRRKQKLSKGKGVPFALVNGVPIHGYNEKAYMQALKKDDSPPKTAQP